MRRYDEMLRYEQVEFEIDEELRARSVRDSAWGIFHDFISAVNNPDIDDPGRDYRLADVFAQTDPLWIIARLFSGEGWVALNEAVWAANEGSYMSYVLSSSTFYAKPFYGWQTAKPVVEFHDQP